MLDGKCYPLPMLELGTCGGGSGLWPTPNCHNHFPPNTSPPGEGKAAPSSKHALQTVVHGIKDGKPWYPTPPAADWSPTDGDLLASIRGYPTQRATWPTPTAIEARTGCGYQNGKGGQVYLTLTGAVGAAKVPDRFYMTPLANDADKGGTNTLDRQIRCGDPKGRNPCAGSLNPDWVEWLQGWPLGWTHLDPLESADIRPWTSDPADNGGSPRVTKVKEHRKDRLKCLGNGQVPQCAAAAFSRMGER